MSYARAETVDFATIPVIDLGGPPETVARAIHDAAIDVGFFYAANHGVPDPVIASAFAAAADFFRLPAEAKSAVKVSPIHRGWLAPGGAKMSTGARPDLKESFIWGLDLPSDDPDVLGGKLLMGPNQWPAEPAHFRPALTAYYAAIRGCGETIMRGFARALGQEPEYFTPAFAKPLARGTAIWYPPQPPDLGETQFGVAPHTDYGCITLLAQDMTGGLQVRNRAGAWIEAPPIPGTFVINIGDLMARWSNDLFVSTPHRVVNSSGHARQSIAVFFDPYGDTPIAALPGTVPAGEAPRYEATTCAAYIKSRFDAAFSYRK